MSLALFTSVAGCGSGSAGSRAETAPPAIEPGPGTGAAPEARTEPEPAAPDASRTEPEPAAPDASRTDGEPVVAEEPPARDAGAPSDPMMEAVVRRAQEPEPDTHVAADAAGADERQSFSPPAMGLSAGTEGLSPEAIRRVIRQRATEMRRCYEVALRTNPRATFEGLRFVQRPDGTVRVEGSSGDRRLDKCARDTVASWRLRGS